MRIKMYMVYFPPEQIKNGCITSVVKIPMSAYDPDLPYRESYAPGELLETKTHYRWEGHTSFVYFAVPAFALCPEGEEQLAGCRFGYATNNQMEDFHEFAGPDEQGLYFDMPALKKEYGVFQLKNTLAGRCLGSVQPGSTRLLLRDRSGSVIFRWNLTVWPSSFGKEEYRRMIDDIFSIERQILQFRPGKKDNIHASNKLGLNIIRMNAVKLWEQTLEDMEQDVAVLTKLFQRMERRPHFALKEAPSKCRIDQVQQVDQNILRQYMQMPSRPYYRTFKAQKSLDIYEHRFLKQTVHQLLAFMEQHTNGLATVSDGVEGRKSALLWKMRQILHTSANNIGEEEILSEWEQYVKRIKDHKAALDYRKEELYEEFMAYYQQSQYTPDIQFAKHLSFQVARLSTDQENTVCEPGKFQWGYQPQWRKRDTHNYWKANMLSIDGKYDHTFIEQIIFRSWDIASQYAFYHATIEAVGDDEEISEGIQIDLTGDFVVHSVKQEKNEKTYINYELVLLGLKDLYIDGQPVPIVSPNTPEWDRQLDAMGKAYSSAKCSSENTEKILLEYGIMESIEAQKQSLMNVPDHIRLHQIYDSRLDQLRLKLSTLQASPLFSGISVESDTIVPWKMTQIFTNDKNYNAAYKRLLDMDKRYDFTLEITNEFIIHEKFDRLYEYWTFAKILEFLILRQGWEAGGSSPARILRNLLKKRSEGKTDFVDLYHECEGNRKLQLKIYYDTPLKESTDVNSDLRPDFLFCLSQDDNGPMYFILDVKYRAYAEMDGYLELDNTDNDIRGYGYWKNNDIYDVSYNKYFNRLRQIGLPISAAFIVHSDKTHLRSNMGKYVTYDAYHDDRCDDLFERNDADIQGEIGRIGSFYLVPYVPDNEKEIPNQSEDFLEAFFQMLFEDYADVWQQCWHCGSMDVDEEILLTEKGYNKYHYRCKSCQAFWVKTHCKDCGTDLVKHNFNHYVESTPGSHWMVICPRCGAGKKEEVPVYDYFDEEMVAYYDEDPPF